MFLFFRFVLSLLYHQPTRCSLLFNNSVPSLRCVAPFASQSQIALASHPHSPVRAISVHLSVVQTPGLGEERHRQLLRRISSSGLNSFIQQAVTSPRVGVRHRHLTRVPLAPRQRRLVQCRAYRPLVWPPLAKVIISPSLMPTDRSDALRICCKNSLGGTTAKTVIPRRTMADPLAPRRLPAVFILFQRHKVKTRYVCYFGR